MHSDTFAVSGILCGFLSPIRSEIVVSAGGATSAGFHSAYRKLTHAKIAKSPIKMSSRHRPRFQYPLSQMKSSLISSYLPILASASFLSRQLPVLRPRSIPIAAKSVWNSIMFN